MNTSSSTPILHVHNVGKKYLINHQKGGYITLRDSLTALFTKPLALLRASLEKKEVFWALRDISFSVEKGDVIGIIGHNGAGKSTLLKLLSRITFPTTGEIRMNGRVGSLLEVGTGFHPELTGRENIFLNGAILGMTKKEIEQKFDAIVAFADIAQFLDTPVKYYSSGMYVRLAFSVAAHMEPDILIVDEVLAVGDMEFQKKCLGKMDDITKKEGRTVLFVSHNMAAIEQLCKKVIVLEKGQVVFQGDTKEGIRRYFTQDNNQQHISEITFSENEDINTNDYVSINRFAITDSEGKTVNTPLTRKSEAYITIEGVIKKTDPSITIGYAISDEAGQTIYWSYHTDTPPSKTLTSGNVCFSSKIPLSLLNKETYKIEIIGGIHHKKWFFEPGKSSALFVSIGGTISDSPLWTDKRPGILAPTLLWNTQQ